MADRTVRLLRLASMPRSRRRLPKTSWALLMALSAAVLIGMQLVAADQPAAETFNPADWGSDHVGKPLPQFVTGDECLFCHRDIGPNWGGNRHNLTIRLASPDAAAMQSLADTPQLADVAREVDLLLGDQRRIRFLKRSDAYGRLDLLSVAYVSSDSGDGRLVDLENPHWDAGTFADRCAGCHATAVDSGTKAFAAVSLDCVTCHGDVPLTHSKDTALVHLSAKNQTPREVISICGQCHLRGGTSRSTGRPYPNHFVAGDNLFRDFQIDWSPAAIEAMSPGDRHIFQNVRDVALLGKLDMTCLSCHNVHDESTERHLELARSAICGVCHAGTQAVTSFQSTEAHSEVCGY